MSHQGQLEKPKYRNWVKGGLAYKYLKEGIEGFADDFFQKEHANILGVVNNTSGNACNQCSLQSLRQTGRCPNNMCSIIMEEIKKSHVSEAPNLKNIDIKKLYTSPWEIAKCFINAPGYSDKTSAADIDVSGLLHLFINNKNLHTHLSCNMTGTRTNIFKECRERRNDIFHSPEMEMEEAEMKKCIYDIKAILQDPKELVQIADAKEAVKKLGELMKKDFIITSQDKAEVVYRDALFNTRIKLEQKIQDVKDDFDRKQTGVSKALDEKIQRDCKDTLEKNSEIQLLKQSVESLNLKIQRLQEKNQQSKSKKYDEDKQALQDGLVKLYQRHYVKTSLSPLKLQENDINIDEVYVEPEMVVVEADKQQSGNGNSRFETGRPVHGYHDLFLSNGRENKAIYIVGGVGSGKSSFCKKMIQDWCKAVNESPNKSVTCDVSNESRTCKKRNDSDGNKTSGTSGNSKESSSDSDQKSLKNDKEEMRKFDFLFYIPLQKMSNYCKITDMTQAICKAENLASTELVERVFEQYSERCLFIIDGLDEWSPKQFNENLSHESYGLPSKQDVKNATVVTLSRPSAKGMLNITSSEIDQKVEIKGILSSSVNSLIQKYLSKQINTSMSYEELKKKIEQSRLKHLDKSPLLLQQLVWLCCNGYDFGTSVSSIYCHLINIMFTWLKTKTNACNAEEECCDNADQYDNMTLPPVLNSLHQCETNKGLLIQLSRVAFESLKSETENKTFSRSGLKRKGFSKTAISSLIKVGLLVEGNCYDPTQEKTQLSFIHMSYCEFFAAVYASCQFDEQQSDKNTSVLTEIFQNCKTAADILQLSNLLKMICGLCPFVITQVSLFISDIVKRDEKLIRQNSKEISWDSSLHQIQKLIFSFLSECDPTVTNDTMVYIADVLIYGSTKMSAFKSVIPDNVITLHVAYFFHDELRKWMTQLKHLQYLYTGFLEISHDHLTMLCSFIQEAHLRCISWCSVRCQQQDCRGHSIDLSKHDRLQKLQIGGCDRIKISNINTEHLETIKLDCTGISDIGLLKNSRCLTELYLSRTYNRQHDSVVHTLHQLQTLAIVHADIDENAFTVTPEMRNLKHIKLDGVEMSLETWRNFVDSLLTLQHVVQVDTYLPRFGRYPDYKMEKSKYVAGKKNMFEIKDDDRYKMGYISGNVPFSFRTIK